MGEDESKRAEREKEPHVRVKKAERLQYLLRLGLVLKEQLEQGGGEGGVGQQGHCGSCPEEACTQRGHQDSQLQNKPDN